MKTFTSSLKLIIAAVLLPVLCEAAPKVTKVLDIGTKPESVCKGFGGKLYVTIIGGDEPGDGAIYVVDGDEVKPFAKGLDNPKGIAFIKGALVTADGTKVFKINNKGKVSVLAEAKDFPAEVEFLNDVAATRSKDAVYVTEMSHPKRMFNPDGDRELWPLDSQQEKDLPKTGCVYKITAEAKVSVAVPSGHKLMPGPNGVTIAGPAPKPFLAMADFFTGNIVTYKGDKLKLVKKNLIRGADAIEVVRGVAYVSSWTEGKVVAYHIKEKKTETILCGLTSAADFYFDRKANQIVVPDMLEGKLHFVSLGE